MSRTSVSFRLRSFGRRRRAALVLSLLALLPLPQGGARAAEPAASLQVTKAQRVLLAKPVAVYWEGERIETRVLVEITVRTPTPVPVESRSPILRVGGRLVGYAEYLEPDVLRFTEHRPDKLPEGGAVSLQMGHGAAKPVYVSSFVYKAAALEVIQRSQR